MKNRKLQLKGIKVESFVTLFDQNELSEMKGGRTRNPSECNQCTTPVYPTHDCYTFPLNDCIVIQSTTC